MARAQRREAVIRALRDHKISQRRVCDVVGVDAKTVPRERPPDNADIRKKMHEIAEKRRRFGYRRIGVMLERDGFTMNGHHLAVAEHFLGTFSGPLKMLNRPMYEDALEGQCLGQTNCPMLLRVH